jgi:hypothetical protein
MNPRCTPDLPFWIARLMALELCIWDAHGGISHAPSSLTHTCLTSSMAQGGVTSDSPTDNSEFHHLGLSFNFSQKLLCCNIFRRPLRPCNFYFHFKDLNLNSFCVCRKVFYGQYHCYGPGATSPQRVPYAHELTALQAKPFLSVNFINGKKWLSHYMKTPKFT